MIEPSDIPPALAGVRDLVTFLRGSGVRGFNGFGLEIVFEPVAGPPPEKPPEAPPDEGAMPTRAEIEATRKRIAEGGTK